MLEYYYISMKFITYMRFSERPFCVLYSDSYKFKMVPIIDTPEELVYKHAEEIQNAEVSSFSGFRQICENEIEN